MGNNLSPVEVLEERLSDAALTSQRDPRISAIFSAALIAIPCVLHAAQAGNMQCKEAVKQILPYLDIICPKK